ncbi:DEKNAAC104868 [Brettanomyces naardenensis]|uniref:Ubiquinone biosynthesis protein n=1 Tax=Brettanomyces naardenensis TaxID=13370 RepID=A0A448YRW5_BRENA|nr:DEKNAAC104868 [Brettanomyces naardenensis]
MLSLIKGLPVTKAAQILPILSAKAASSSNCARSYHSFYHVEPPIADPSSLENQILAKAYTEFVPKVGFTEKAVNRAAAALGTNPNSLGAIFNFTTPSHDIAMELALYHLKFARQEMHDQNKEKAISLPNEKERLKFYVAQRLLLNRPVIDFYYQALGRMILPSNVSESLKELHNLADDISYYAGDRSTDFAWYSKRFAVAGAFVQSELFMLKDNSPDFRDTIQFASDRLDEVDKLGRIYNSFEEWLLFNGISTINMIRSQLVRG